MQRPLALPSLRSSSLPHFLTPSPFPKKEKERPETAPPFRFPYRSPAPRFPRERFAIPCRRLTSDVPIIDPIPSAIWAPAFAAAPFQLLGFQFPFHRFGLRFGLFPASGSGLRALRQTDLGVRPSCYIGSRMWFSKLIPERGNGRPSPCKSARGYSGMQGDRRGRCRPPRARVRR